MKTACIEEIEKYLKEVLSEERFIHTLGVKEEAMELAKIYGLDIKKAEFAGVLHDNAKCMSNEDLRAFIDKNIRVYDSEIDSLPVLKEGEILADKNELKNYKTLHAPVGAYLAREKFGINDNEIISSIRWHTLGKLDMTTFEKIIFLADKIEKRTRPIEYRNSIYKILNDNNGEQGLNKALLVCFKETLKSLANRELYICKSTINVYNWLLEISKNK